MVDVSSVMQLVANVGFPIAVALAMWWELGKEREDHKTETRLLAEAINSNTAVMQRLVDRLDHAEH